MEFHGNEVSEDVMESGVRDVVEGLDVVLSRKAQTERLLIVHYIINDHFDQTYTQHNIKHHHKIYPIITYAQILSKWSFLS